MLVNPQSVRNHLPCCAACLRSTVHDEWNVAYLNEQDGSLIGAQMNLSPCSDAVLDPMDLGKPRKSKESRPVRSEIRTQMFQAKRKCVNGLLSAEIRARHQTVQLIRWQRVSFLFFCISRNFITVFTRTSN